jgi:cell division protein FtsB
MAILYEIRVRARKILPTVLAASVVGYFGYHALHGERGFLAWRELKGDLVAAQTVEAELADRRSRLERRTALLRADNLDPDLLEERARVLLGYGDPGDLVVLRPGRPAQAHKQ